MKTKTSSFLNKNRLNLIISGLVVVVVLTVLLFKPGGTNITQDGKNTDIAVEVVDNDETRRLGLSGRESLARDSGMLFYFDQPQIPSFWMKDMNFSLDIIWINSEKQVIGIEPGVSPDTYPETFSPPSEVKYVLEINSGLSGDFEITEGSSLDW